MKKLSDKKEKSAVKKTIIERVKTFEDACREANVSPESLFNENDTLDERAYKKLKLIIRVINDGWNPNWGNGAERKWYPWFYVAADAARPGGFGFSDSGCVSWHTHTICGSRLCLQTKEKANYVGKQFEDIYNEFLITGNSAGTTGD